MADPLFNDEELAAHLERLRKLQLDLVAPALKAYRRLYEAAEPGMRAYQSQVRMIGSALDAYRRTYEQIAIPARVWQQVNLSCVEPVA